MKKQYAWLLWVILLLSACIPIEDKFKPFILDFDLEDSYAVEDSIQLTAQLTDDVGIEKIYITVGYNDPEDPTAWTKSDSFDTRGGLFYDLDTFLVVPSRAKLGGYFMNITVRDAGGNIESATEEFVIRGDERGPRFNEVTIISLLPDELSAGSDGISFGGTYFACPSQTVFFRGTLADNLGISKLTAFYENLPEGVEELEETRVFDDLATIDLENIFGDDLKIPLGLEPEDKFLLVLEAEDADGNTSRYEFDLVADDDCDSEPPVITVIETVPEIDLDLNEAGIVQGDTLYLTQIEVTDNRTIKRFVASLRTPTTGEFDLLNDTVGGSSPYIPELVFVPIPASARPGSEYELTLLAADERGNQDSYKILITVLRDTPPDIFITGREVSPTGAEEDIPLSTVSDVAIKRSSRLRIEGKIKEDIAFASIKISWGVVSEEEVKVNLTEDDLEGLKIYDFASGENEFQVPDVPSGTKLHLIVEAVDKLGQTNKKVYTFAVE